MKPVPNRNPRFDRIKTIDEVSPHSLREIEHFFTIYKELEGKHTEMHGWQGAREARETIVAARGHYVSTHSKETQVVPQ